MKGTTLRMDLDAIAYHYEQLANGTSTLAQNGHLALVRRLRERAMGLAPPCAWHARESSEEPGCDYKDSQCSGREAFEGAKFCATHLHPSKAVASDR